jgi:hypothetical protein
MNEDLGEINIRLASEKIHCPAQKEAKLIFRNAFC